MAKCKETTTLEDEICILSFQCELEDGHEGAHRTTYPGIDDNDPSSPVYWHGTVKKAGTFKRNNQVSDDYYK